MKNCYLKFSLVFRFLFKAFFNCLGFKGKFSYLIDVFQIFT